MSRFSSQHDNVWLRPARAGSAWEFVGKGMLEDPAPVDYDMVLYELQGKLYAFQNKFGYAADTIHMPTSVLEHLIEQHVGSVDTWVQLGLPTLRLWGCTVRESDVFALAGTRG